MAFSILRSFPWEVVLQSYCSTSGYDIAKIAAGAAAVVGEALPAPAPKPCPKRSPRASLAVRKAVADARRARRAYQRARAHLARANARVKEAELGLGPIPSCTRCFEAAAANSERIWWALGGFLPWPVWRALSWLLSFTRTVDFRNDGRRPVRPPAIRP